MMLEFQTVTCGDYLVLFRGDELLRFIPPSRQLRLI